MAAPSSNSVPSPFGRILFTLGLGLLALFAASFWRNLRAGNGSFWLAIDDGCLLYTSYAAPGLPPSDFTWTICDADIRRQRQQLQWAKRSENPPRWDTILPLWPIPIGLMAAGITLNEIAKHRADKAARPAAA